MPGQHCAGGVPVVKVRDIFDGRIDESDLLFTHPSIDGAYKRSRLAAGDLLITIRGTTGRVALTPSTLAGANITQDTARIRVKGGTSSEFVYFALQSEQAQQQIALHTIGQAVKGINIRDVRRLTFPIPKKEGEQRAIARALSDVDALLAGLDRLIAKKRDLKEAAMQQLLTGRIRLPGFQGEWTTKRLGQICEIAMGRTPPRLDPAMWGEGHVWLSIADLTAKVVENSKEQVTDLAATLMTVIPKGTLLMSFKLSIGRLCFAGCDLFTNEAICSFNKLQANAEFLFYQLGRTDFSLYGKQAVKGYTLNKESLSLVEVPLPPPDEQAAIAASLSDLDVELAALESRRDKTCALKQAMMQELLTGRIRLI
jgi:type I restriction enzyme S subunit